MIFVTVGTHTDGFLRLVEGMDRLAADLSEEVVMQIGATPYMPSHARWFTFVSHDEVAGLARDARIIVSHAGAGSIMEALRYRKPLIVVPRLRKYGEHLDDHQTELAEALARSGSLLVAYEIADLTPQLARAAAFTPRQPDPGCLIEAVRRAIVA